MIKIICSECGGTCHIYSEYIECGWTYDTYTEYTIRCDNCELDIPIDTIAREDK